MLFHELIENDSYKNVIFTADVRSMLLTSKNEELEIVLSADDVIAKRFIHALNWCMKKNTSHSYHQYLFQKCKKGEAFSRKISISVISDGLLSVQIRAIESFESSFFGDNMGLDILESMTDACVITEAEPIDIPGPRILYVNSAFEKMTGHQRRDVIGKNPRILQGDHTSPEDRKIIREGLKNWQDITTTILNYKSDGSPFLVELKISPVKDKTGWWTHHVSIQRDLDSIKDEKYKLWQRDHILSLLKIGLWHWDIKNNILNWDDSMYNLYGVNREDFSGDVEAWENTLHPDDRENSRARLKKALEGSEEFNLTFAINHGCGEKRYIQARGEVINDKDGRPTDMFGINSDHTAEVKLLTEIENQKKENLHHAKLASIGELAAGIGHEINNPLAIAKGYIRELEKSISNQTYKEIPELISKISYAHERVSNIVDGLRTFSRHETKKGHLFDISASVKESFNLVQRIYNSQGIDLSLNIHDSALKSHVFGDRDAIQQVLMNLLSNAKDAVEDQVEKKIHLECLVENSIYTLKVKDNGHGIKPEILEKIFQPFFTTKEIHKGTGIGLGKVNSICKEHGGSVRVESTENSGTTFIVTIPTSTKALDHAQNTKNTTAPLFVNTILLVEDEADLLSIFVDILEDLGFEVHGFSNGLEAISFLQEQKFEPDLIISDIQMPKMDGIEFLKAIQTIENAKKSNFIFMTGGFDHSIENQSPDLLNAYDGLIYKPFDEKELLKVIGSLKPK